MDGGGGLLLVVVALLPPPPLVVAAGGGIDGAASMLVNVLRMNDACQRFRDLRLNQDEKSA